MLDLSNNSLTGLPPELGKMTTLRKLLLNGNPLRTLRSSLVSGPTATLLKYLQSRLSEGEDSKSTTPAKKDLISMTARLSVSSKNVYNTVTVSSSLLSTSFLCKEGILEISLQGLGLSSVPSEVWESNEIVKADLSRNSIQELPVELSFCVSLQCLILSRNKISDWPFAVLKSLPNLFMFEAGQQCSYTDSIRWISSKLYLRQVQLREIPSDILSLQQLQVLNLSQNSLHSIPEGFKNLSSLTELDLSDNNISALPPELGLLEPSLQALRLDGNPLRSIRRTILDRGTKAVLKYLMDKLPEH
ncbi:hypothetical protein OIU84_003006 [Salix udensis]|uniref:Uncharacterized protein n=1 Tax=Salix udensis TaxID=889485 RepID=A0AAD6P5B8_9ROSI|nr:hypothetical protein OIU84_003006 [Salix udensis]